MEHILNCITREYIIRAAKEIQKEGVDKNCDWNEYYVEIEDALFPFKSLVLRAYSYTEKADLDFECKSNESNRNKIRDLGYNILYLKGGMKYSEVNRNGLLVENKMSRVVWNENGWVTPSGPKGKSKTESYEKSHGYGHEEWNFNTKYVLGEYKYGFLEPINKHCKLYEGKLFNIMLFTRNRCDKSDYWVMALDNVEVINEEEANWVMKQYKKKGWLNEMKEDLENLNLDAPKSDEWTKEVKSLFNIKFKASQLFKGCILSPVELGDIRIHRYTLMSMPEDLEQKLKNQVKTHGSFEDSGSYDVNVFSSPIKRNYQTRETEIEINHGKIQEGFMRYLQQKYGKDNVKRECTGYGRTKIDITRRTPDGEVYYEVKSYSSLLTSFRQGIGQLLEYCLFPDVVKAKKIVLVSDINPRGDKELESYVEHVGKYLKIPFGYVCFDIEKKEVVYENGGE